MSRVTFCDICKRPTDEIVGKLFYTPMVPGTGAKSAYSKYELHLDVGLCCEETLKSNYRWRKRMSAKQYAASRRKQSRQHK